MLLLQAAGGANPNMSLFFMIAMVAVFYFLFIRPNQKKQKEINTFRNNLLAGDFALTNGGIKGKIKEINGEWVLLEIAKDVNVNVLKSCLNPITETEQKK